MGGPIRFADHPAMNTTRPDPHPGHAALRKGRMSLPNHVYFVTFITRGRRPLFRDGDLAMAACRSISDRRIWSDAQLLAWVLMPDHWHGLIQVGADGDLSGTIRRLKCNSAGQVRAEFPGLGPVWARAFHDRAVRAEDDLLAAARYLIMNPVRAGLVDKVRDYPFWNACWL